MLKFGPWGVLWSLCLRYFPSRYDPEIAQRLRKSKEALGIFFGSGSFLVASECGFKETLWSLGSERLEKDGKLKFCRELPSFISGPRNFIQLNMSIGIYFNFNFSRTSPEITSFLKSPTNDIS